MALSVLDGYAPLPPATTGKSSGLAIGIPSAEVSVQ